MDAFSNVLIGAMALGLGAITGIVLTLATALTAYRVGFLGSFFCRGPVTSIR